MTPTLNVTVIVTRDSKLVSSEHVNDSTMFASEEAASAYTTALMEWVAMRPDPADPSAWQPVRVVEVPTPHDAATHQAVELERILQPRDGELFDEPDAEAIASEAEHRPYDADRLP